MTAVTADTGPQWSQRCLNRWVDHGDLNNYADPYDTPWYVCHAPLDEPCRERWTDPTDGVGCPTFEQWVVLVDWFGEGPEGATHQGGLFRCENAGLEPYPTEYRAEFQSGDRGEYLYFNVETDRMVDHHLLSGDSEWCCEGEFVGYLRYKVNPGSSVLHEDTGCVELCPEDFGLPPDPECSGRRWSARAAAEGR